MIDAHQVAAGGARTGGSRGRMLLLFALVPVTMALMAFVVFPSFYSAWCKLTGTGLDNSGSGQQPAAPDRAVVDGNRRPIEIYFAGQVYDGLPVTLEPVKRLVSIRPGEEGVNTYRFRNNSTKAVRFRPVHSVAPVQAAPHFVMRQCFCFTDQEVEAGGTREYPVTFTFDPAIDVRVSTTTVSYALFRIDEGAKPSEAMLRIRTMLEQNGGIVSPPPSTTASGAAIP
jgi:cytochrome c oxidase assembly protein subunit 11